ncbi:hypothetical protein BDV98DRAFT_43786 [Pterulicium gracile]|uniref:Uncharacterized protein n=1 Tax=Pterulicium gracile TaxID=1884261 RepID=A0A5C3QIL2_9AGAR|nr:hypothetical protein BDV98DRAFT_43786 [Pterula gracilis]
MEGISILERFPDDHSSKPVYLQAAGRSFSGDQRHVSIWWANHDAPNLLVAQMMQLTGTPGVYRWESTGQIKDRVALESDDIYELGTYTRSQRDRMVELAGSIQFDSRSIVNGCRVWTHDLLKAMAADDEQLLDAQLLAMLVEEVPLPERRAEL